MKIVPVARHIRWSHPIVLLLTLLMTAMPLARADDTDPDSNSHAAAEILATDRAFATMSRNQGPATAFQRFAADDAVAFNNPTSHVARNDWPKFFAVGNQLVWQPAEAHASADGTMGWSWGRYLWVQSKVGEDDQRSTGRYFTVWQKQADGAWHFTADIATADRPVAEAPE